MVFYHIIQPTRVTEDTATVIDNIFNNNIQDDIINGNILLTLSEHFSQFVSVKWEKIDLKSINIFQQDYTKFYKPFEMMSQCQTGVILMIMFMIHSWIFIIDLKDLLIDMPLWRSYPLKKIKTRNKPWLSTDVLKMIKIRNKVFATKQRQPNNENCKHLYNLLRNRINRA